MQHLTSGAVVRKRRDGDLPTREIRVLLSLLRQIR